MGLCCDTFWDPERASILQHVRRRPVAGALRPAAPAPLDSRCGLRYNQSIIEGNSVGLLPVKIDAQKVVRMCRAIAVQAQDNYMLWVQYDDGVAGRVDLSNLVGKGVFAAWTDRRVFEKVHIGPSGEIAWNDQIDMCPDAMYLKITGKKPEELFPALTQVLQHA